MKHILTDFYGVCALLCVVSSMAGGGPDVPASVKVEEYCLLHNPHRRLNRCPGKKYKYMDGHICMQCYNRQQLLKKRAAPPVAADPDDPPAAPPPKKIKTSHPGEMSTRHSTKTQSHFDIHHCRFNVNAWCLSGRPPIN